MVHPGAYRGNKRQKELKRLQKQEEKRQKRLQKKAGELGEQEIPPDEAAPLPVEPGAEPPASEVTGGENPVHKPE